MTPADDLLGNPKQFARRQFDIARQLCGACRDYHALWPYRRLSGMVLDADGDAHLVGPLIREHAQKGARILIAGAADAGLYALAEQSTRGLAAAITVADRCPTPLSLCQDFADLHGTAVTLLREDLAQHRPTGAYDIILTHSFLQFVAEADRRDFFRGIAGSLAAGGAWIIAERLRPTLPEQRREAGYADDVVAALRRIDIVLPEEPARFRERLSGSVESRGRRLSTALGPRDVPAYLESTGLVLADLQRHMLRRRHTAEQSGAPDLDLQIAVARA